MFRVVVMTLCVSVCGCSNQSQVLQDLKQQNAALESQRKLMDQMSISLRDMEQRHQQSQDALAAKDSENQALAQKLSAAEARIDQVTQRAEHQVQRPTFSVEEPKITIQHSTPAVRKRSADLIIRSVNVYGTRENGSPWDESGPPDLKVFVSNGRDDYTTSVKRDTESATYDVKALRVEEDDLLEIIVYDNDVLFDDTIGSYSKLITADTLNQREVTWSFGRVYELVLEFEP